MKSRFAAYYWPTLVRPSETFKLLIEDKHVVSLGFRAVLLMAVLYTFVYVFLVFGGGHPFKPWLDIPSDIYYQYNVFFCAPSMILGWILCAGVVHVLSRIVSTTGTFEQILGVFGFGIGIAPWSTGVHDLLTSFLGAIHVIDQREYEEALNSPSIWRTILWILMTAYVVWFVVLFSKGVRTVYRLSGGLAVLLGTIGFIVFQLFFLIFNR